MGNWWFLFWSATWPAQLLQSWLRIGKKDDCYYTVVSPSIIRRKSHLHVFLLLQFYPSLKREMIKNNSKCTCHHNDKEIVSVEKSSDIISLILLIHSGFYTFKLKFRVSLQRDEHRWLTLLAVWLTEFNIFKNQSSLAVLWTIGLFSLFQHSLFTWDWGVQWLHHTVQTVAPDWPGDSRVEAWGHLFWWLGWSSVLVGVAAVQFELWSLWFNGWTTLVL